MDGNGVAAKFDGLISKRFLAIAGGLIMLLLGALGYSLRGYVDSQAAQLADHRRWLSAMQMQVDAAATEQARRTPIVNAAERAVVAINDIRVDVAVVKQQVQQLTSDLRDVKLPTRSPQHEGR